MIRLKLRLLACAATAFLLHQPAHAEPAATPPVLKLDPVATQLPHISIVTAGRGSPVVFIPGLASPRAVWDGPAAALAKTHQVILVQVNGFGGDAPGDNLKPGLLDGIVADLHTYLARRKLTGVPVVGHSMGGLVAMMWAKAHPGDVGKAMIVDSLPFFAVLMAPPGVEVTTAMVEPQARAMRDKVAANYGKPADAAVIEVQTRGLALKPDSIAKMKRWAAAADPRVTAEAVYEDLTTDLRGDLRAIGTPLIIVYPWNANGLPKEMVDRFYRKQFATAPNVRFIDIGDSAHFVMLDQPVAFQAALDAWLDH